MERVTDYRGVKYLGKSFSTPANSRAYVENWDAVFGEPSVAKCGVCNHAESLHQEEGYDWVCLSENCPCAEDLPKDRLVALFADPVG